MVKRQSRAQLLDQGEVVSPPETHSCADHTFELPTGIYVVMIMMFVGFIGLLGLSFRGGHMIVVLGVILAFLTAYFGIPAIFVLATPQHARKSALSWDQFGERGIATATGQSSARDATILVLLLPTLIFSFAVAVTGIAALVS